MSGQVFRGDEISNLQLSYFLHKTKQGLSIGQDTSLEKKNKKRMLPVIGLAIFSPTRVDE